MTGTQIAAFVILGGFLLFCLAYAYFEYRSAIWVDDDEQPQTSPPSTARAR